MNAPAAASIDQLARVYVEAAVKALLAEADAGDRSAQPGEFIAGCLSADASGDPALAASATDAVALMARPDRTGPLASADTGGVTLPDIRGSRASGALASAVQGRSGAVVSGADRPVQVGIVNVGGPA